MSKIIHFVPNEPDDNHCFQASFMMAVEALGGERLDMQAAERLTNFVADCPTWPYKGLLSLADRGLYVRYTEDFSLRRFITAPKELIFEHVNDPQIAEEVIRKSDFSVEAVFAQACLEHPQITIDERRPKLDDLKRELSLGSLAIVNVNYFRLLEKVGYAGHFVVVEAVDEEEVLLQNPGLPPIPNQRVAMATFLAAWHFPNDRLANIIAIRATPFQFGI